MAVANRQPTKVALFYDLPTMWVYFFAILWFWARHRQPPTTTTPRVAHRHDTEGGGDS